MPYFNHNLKAKECTTSWGNLSGIELGEKGTGRIRDLITMDTTDPTIVDLNTTKSGRLRLQESMEYAEGWISVISTQTKAYQKKSVGYIQVDSKIEVLAFGVKAIGKAGRASVAPEYLITTPFNSWVHVHPVGNEQDYYLHFQVNGVVTISAEELDSYLDWVQETIPTLHRVPVKTDITQEHKQNLKQLNANMKRTY